MPSETPAESPVEIGHVLFVDIVGYSKRLVNEQTALIQRLNRLVRSTEEFHKADAAGKLITIPTGDGMALVFFTVRIISRRSASYCGRKFSEKTA